MHPPPMLDQATKLVEGWNRDDGIELTAPVRPAAMSN